MDLTTALELAKRGRSQAEAEALESGDVSVGRHDPSTTGERSAETPVTRLEPGEFDSWVEDVAMEMVSRTVEGRHWYDLSGAEKDKWRKLAKLAILSVQTATLSRTLREIRAGREVGPIDDLRAREAAAFGDPRGRAA